jgi:hypothetical protein
MEIFATGLSSPECPIILDNGDLLVVEMRQDRSAITRIDGTTRDIHPIKVTGSFPNGKFAEDGRLFCTGMGAGEIAVFDTSGQVVERIATAGAAPANIAFTEDGSHRMYGTEITQGAVEVHDVNVDGLPIFRQLLVAGAPPACSSPPYLATPRSKEASS